MSTSVMLNTSNKFLSEIDTAHQLLKPVGPQTNEGKVYSISPTVKNIKK